MALTPNFAANDVTSISVIVGSPSGGNTVKGQARQDGYWEFLIIEAPREGMEPPSLPLIRSEGGPISVFHLEPSRWILKEMFGESAGPEDLGHLRRWSDGLGIAHGDRC